MTGRTSTVIFLLFLVSIGAQASGQGFLFEKKVVASDREESDTYGHAVGITSGLAVIGAPREGGLYSPGVPAEEGAVYVFEADLAGNFIPMQKLVPATRIPGEFFGGAVGISFSYLIVGASDEALFSFGSNQAPGQVYLFKNIGNNWIQEARFPYNGPNGPTLLGASVGIYYEDAIAGCVGDTVGGYSGSAFIYQKDNSNWSETQRLLPSTVLPNSIFGIEVSMDYRYAAVGGTQRQMVNGTLVSNFGSVTLYKKNNNDVWIESQVLTPPGPNQPSGFGRSIDIKVDRMVIGAPFDSLDAGGSSPLLQAGAAYVYQLDTFGQWNFMEKILPQDRAMLHNFGQDVSVNGNRIVVGSKTGNHPQDTIASGAVYTFAKQNGSWIQTQRLVPPVRQLNSSFGHSVALNADNLLVGDPSQFYDEQEMNLLASAGAGYFYSDTGFVVGVEVQAMGREVSVFPNPTSGLIHLELPERSESAVVEVEVKNTMGVSILKQRFENLSEAQLDLTGISKGLYLVNVLVDGNTATMSQLKVYLQ